MNCELAGHVTRDRPQTRVSPPDELLKGLLGERATGCWELEPKGLGKSETHMGGVGAFSVNSTFLSTNMSNKQDNTGLKD